MVICDVFFLLFLHRATYESSLGRGTLYFHESVMTLGRELVQSLEAPLSWDNRRKGRIGRIRMQKVDDFGTWWKIGDQMFFKYYIIHFKTQLYVFL